LAQASKRWEELVVMGEEVAVMRAREGKGDARNAMEGADV
jgi:hypothetical protein